MSGHLNVGSRLKRTVAHLGRMSVAEQVRRALAQNPALSHALELGVLNLRATARHMRKNSVRASEDAILSALRRLRADEPSVKSPTGILAQARILVVEPVASVTVSWRRARGATETALDPEILRSLSPRWQVQSPDGLRLIVDEDRLDSANTIFRLPEIQVRRNLAEIDVRLPLDARPVPGVLALACQRLASAGVNIVETVDGFGHHTFLVPREESSRASLALGGRGPP